MSYYAIFKPTKEAIDKVKEKDPLSYRQSDAQNLRKELEIELLMLCMKGSEDTVRNVMFAISTRLNMLKSIAIHQCITAACEQFESDENNEITYCGWDKARRYCDWTDKDSIDRVTETLLMHALVIPTKDYYDSKESEMFYEKWNTVKEEIEGFSESIYDWYVFEIMEQLVDYRIGEETGHDWWVQSEETIEENDNENGNE